MTDGGQSTDDTKRMRIPSVLVDCRDCSRTFEIDARTFDLAIERGSGSFLCGDCDVDTDTDR